LKELPKNKRARRGRCAYWPEIELKLKEWITKVREDKRKLSTINIRFQATKIAKELSISDFKGTAH
uniref:hypothetical protein n=1 Tax=Escherichia coli TaxID=562 RepID=UPI003C7414B6